MPLVSGRVDKEDEWAAYRIERDLFCGQMIYRCHKKIQKNEPSDRAMKERRDGQIDRREVICRVMAFQPDVQSSQVQWLNYWKAVLKGFSDT